LASNSCPSYHDQQVLPIRLQRASLLVQVVVLVIGLLQPWLGVPEHGVADFLVEPEVGQPGLAGHQEIVHPIVPEPETGARPSTNLSVDNCLALG